MSEEEKELTLREKLFWKMFWRFSRHALRLARPRETETYRGRVLRVLQGFRRPITGKLARTAPWLASTSPAVEAVWRGGRWTLQDGDFEAYYNANPHKTRPVRVEPPPKPLENETREAYLERMQTTGFGGYFGDNVPKEAIWMNGEWV